MYQRCEEMKDPRELRSLAMWYREFAERTGNPAIWEGRLKTAEALEREASRLQGRVVPRSSGSPINDAILQSALVYRAG